MSYSDSWISWWWHILVDTPQLSLEADNQSFSRRHEGSDSAHGFDLSLLTRDISTASRDHNFDDCHVYLQTYHLPQPACLDGIVQFRIWSIFWSSLLLAVLLTSDERLSSKNLWHFHHPWIPSFPWFHSTWPRIMDLIQGSTLIGIWHSGKSNWRTGRRTIHEVAVGW